MITNAVIKNHSLLNKKIVYAISLDYFLVSHMCIEFSTYSRTKYIQSQSFVLKPEVLYEFSIIILYCLFSKKLIVYSMFIYFVVNLYL